MTSFVTVPNSDTDIDSKIDQALLNALRDNPIAITEKAAGAPVLANDYIVQAMLKTSTSAQSASLPAGSVGSITLTGGTWSLVTAPSAGVLSYYYVGNLAAGKWGMRSGSGSASTIYIDSRYHSASPPYGTVDGEIPLFVYVHIEKGSGKILGVSVAPVPIWAYNGPTDIRADIQKKDGRSIKIVPQVIAEMGSVKEFRKQMKTALLAGKRKIVRDLRMRRRKDPMVELEMSLDYKNSDMNIAPHPWLEHDLNSRASRTGPNGKSFEGYGASEIVLLDPQNTLDLYDLHNDGENILKMVEDGTIKIDNTDLNRIVPAGMKAYGFRY